MTFDETMAEVAHIADGAVWNTVRSLDRGRVKHEDDLNGVLVGKLEERMDGLRVRGLTFEAAILTHRVGGEEGRYGADILIHVEMNTPEQKYSKGVLIQAKRVQRGQNMRARDHQDLVSQCHTMLAVTPASFVFCYDPSGVRSSSATRIAGGSGRDFYNRMEWTSYRFLLEMFRCPIGDIRITSADVADLASIALHIRGEGVID
jgi:hypothetical protein